MKFRNNSSTYSWAFSDSNLLVNVNRYLFSTEDVEFDDVVNQLKYLRNIDMGKKKGNPKIPF